MSEQKMAVLIDADNVPYSSIKEMLEEVAKNGTPTIKRIYADWTKPNANGWKGVLLENAITPIQQYSYTSGKNSSDSALIIDAMDILYSQQVDAFCIVSSDSDFTRLATRLRESGKKVMGIGEKKTPLPFITACDKFVYIEILKQKTVPSKSEEKQKENKKEATPMNKVDQSLVALLKDSVSDLADETGWTFLGELGNFLLKKKRDFDPRNYGFQKLLPLIKSMDEFEIDIRETSNKNTKHIFVKVKE
ncbi:NYN domain-containing protein [Fluviicola chungangensis]|uniref:NYN domain-containing protein n=1 Tax=Fluviicola chungangensis TaxID=2597671 RepID=A0A556MR58_9FLAO|nr:NYN domain-containing protein [Fluviicola chungangensis]TSJ42424.1 NYN domain-containing protein [Fluviicola chungangensis]